MSRFRFHRRVEHNERAQDESDAVVRRRVTLWEPHPPKNDSLMGLYRYWEALRPDGLLPVRADFDLQKLPPASGTTWLINVDPDDPLEFRMRSQGHTLPLDGDPLKFRLRDIRSKPYREMLATDYRAVKEIGTPAYHDIATRIDDVTLSYARLILPFAEDGRRVTELYACMADGRFLNLVKPLRDAAKGDR